MAMTEGDLKPESHIVAMQGMVIQTVWLRLEGDLISKEYGIYHTDRGFRF